MDRLGLTSAAQLARELGLTGYESPRRVRRWLDGTNDPDYAMTVALLDRLGAVNWAALRPGSLEAAVGEVAGVLRDYPDVLPEPQSAPGRARGGGREG